ncbi:MAG: ECF transporter S component [Lachnospiraceae bacterium]|nr:ECF transporter S component [Lachnospiraceae bacterium]
MLKMTNTARVMEKNGLSIKTQTLAAFAAIVAAVALPQIFHLIGVISGVGTALGEVFLPMHLPILLVGFLAGPYAGAVAGMCGPVVSFALSGMPGAAMLPFMMLELSIYGLSAGLLKNVRMPIIAKIVISQAAGRVIRAVVILIAIYVFGNKNISVSAIWMSIRTGIFGLILQWAMIPFIVCGVERMQKYED